ncbi:hypothetical protein CANCADRAFT_42738 [Tortispora caseinolytica NRRL Y-17796]|uniref:Zn(2)-C6 fungal-type domain-containing protein n=1 Tax=Tortispora caseinolytica NRRL Y-17796 TaxID=767744 RepID=A0A1E4TK64_9ASCO|nr:hypothetical protein CANCADRAFT_42738 [Tortispora caseinolytica NRRL Y-17796]
MAKERLRQQVTAEPLSGSDQEHTARPYRSRKQRPCDYCRARKHHCKILVAPPCELCKACKRPCTFVEGSTKRIRHPEGKNRERARKGPKPRQTSPNSSRSSSINQSNSEDNMRPRFRAEVQHSALLPSSLLSTNSSFSEIQHNIQNSQVFPQSISPYEPTPYVMNDMQYIFSDTQLQGYEEGLERQHLDEPDYSNIANYTSEVGSWSSYNSLYSCNYLHDRSTQSLPETYQSTLFDYPPAHSLSGHRYSTGNTTAYASYSRSMSHAAETSNFRTDIQHQLPQEPQTESVIYQHDPNEQTNDPQPLFSPTWPDGYQAFSRHDSTDNI